MNCYLAGTIGIALLGATFYTMNAQQVAKDYRSLEAYDNIVKERSNIYFQCTLQGLYWDRALQFR